MILRAQDAARTPVPNPIPTATLPELAAVRMTAAVEVARRFDPGPSMLARIVGIRQPTASRRMKGPYRFREPANERELAAHRVRIDRSRLARVGGDEGLARPSDGRRGRIRSVPATGTVWLGDADIHCGRPAARLRGCSPTTIRPATPDGGTAGLSGGATSVLNPLIHRRSG